MTTQTEALKLALEALEDAQYFIEAELNDRMDLYKNYPNLAHKYAGEQESLRKNQEAITAIKEALEHPEQGCDYCNHSLYAGTICKNCGKVTSQPEQEPVAITITGKLGNIYSFTGDYSLKKGDKVYTTPPQRKPLTDEQIEKLAWKHGITWAYEYGEVVGLEQIKAFLDEAANAIKVDT